MAFTTVTVTGTYDVQGNPASGTLTFTLTAPMSNSNVSVVPQPIRVTLANGSFSVSLYANDDTATVPQGVSWGVTEQISGAQPRDYFITVPSADGTVDISTLTPAGLGWQ